MTTIEFWSKLAATPRQWFLDGDRIRILSIALDTKPTDQSLTCPGNAACAKIGVTDVIMNGMERGLSATFVDQVVLSADWVGGPYRSKLMEACGL